MPNSTVTVRKLKNKDSGLDLAVVSCLDLPGVVHSTQQYTVVVVSNLQCFKLPHHKDTDVVQFVVVKTYENFEALVHNLCQLFPDIVLPTLPHSLLPAFLRADTAQKKSDVDTLLRYIAITPRLATCHVTLQFLGINAITAGKFTKTDITQEHQATRKSSSQTGKLTGLFDAEEDDSSDLFGTESDTKTDNLFITDTKPIRTSVGSQLLTSSDLDLHGVCADDELILIAPGAAVKSDVITRDIIQDDDDISSFLSSDDDLLKLLSVTRDTSHVTKAAEISTNEQKAPQPSSQKPNILPTKPQILTEKPRTVITKPQPLTTKPKVGIPTSQQKPIVPPRPREHQITTDDVTSHHQSITSSKQEAAFVDKSTLDADDILKYITENSQSEQNMPDLF